MAALASPSWADVAWNPILGCAVAVSDRGAETDLRPYEPIRVPYVRRLRTKQPPPDVMGGEPLSTRTRFKSGWLRAPMGWKVPLRICVCVPNDLFVEGAPDDKIDAIFAVTAMAPWHTFLIATRHPVRMHAYLRKEDRGGDVRPFQIEKAARRINGDLPDGTFPNFRSMPFPNVELGLAAGAPEADNRLLLEDLQAVTAAPLFTIPAPCDGEPVWMAAVQHGGEALATTYDVTPHERRRWWPFREPDRWNGLSVPSDWVFRDQMDYGDIAEFIAIDELGKTGLTFGEGGAAIWDTPLPKGVHLKDDGDEFEADSPDSYVNRLIVTYAGTYEALPPPGARFLVKVERHSAKVRCRLLLVSGVVCFVALDPPPTLYDPLPPPLGPATPLPPNPDL